MAYIGDPIWFLHQSKVKFMPYQDWKKSMETRPDWGVYWPDNYPDNDLDFFDRQVYCWVSGVLPGETPIEEVQDLTEWLKLNIDNVWEGPIGYMGVWKFRFTEESDNMIFKLMTV